MKTRRISLKIFIAVMMSVILMASFALTTFAANNNSIPMNITYGDFSFAITGKSLPIYNADHDAIGLITIYLVQTGYYSYYMDYQITMLDGKSSDYMGCTIVRNDRDPNDLHETIETPLENAFYSGNTGMLQNTLPDIPVGIYTESIVATLTIYYYNTNTSLLEMYRTTFTFNFHYQLVANPILSIVLTDASYTQP